MVKRGSERQPKTSGGSSAVLAIPWWLRIVVVLGALLLATGAAIALLHPAMLVSPHDEINGAVRVYAGYLVSRNLALAIMLLLLLFLGARQTLSNLMIVVATVQVLDACLDCAEGRWSIAPGVLVFGALFLFGAARLSGHPFWKAKAWQ